ncbi:centrosomal protein of 41 kDa isoform X2 [Microcaecilia unicolor]|uniref:Centrosomal protein of 41 kDa isoform X2 n=1 Tax=Microcaecilia unicolor TaxID=1415580 RepID=A0A6P7ZB04_9AMPH|nr:centrosomal protein of 41 kDa isoform X2 [Microcaecilia unicolor]
MARRSLGDPEYLKKRIPQNPKYQHIKSRLDTGNSMTKYMEKLEEINKNYRYRKDELFKRLKVSTFAQLVIQVANLTNETVEVTNDEVQRLEDNNSVASETETEILTDRTNGKDSPEEVPSSPVKFINNNIGAGEPFHSSRSTLQSVISGVGEMDLGKEIKEKTNPSATPCPRILDIPYPDCPFLLLDVRDRDAYNSCHIIGAHSYPVAMLSRTMSPFTSDILEFNAHGKIIILYDEDERIASQAATTMCERGFENVFMLSGGLKIIAQKFPEGLITGSFPETCLQQPNQAGPARKRSMSREPPLPAENKWRFSASDLEKLEQHLERILIATEGSRRFGHLSAGRLESKTISSRSNKSTSSATSTSSRSLGGTSLLNKPWR